MALNPRTPLMRLHRMLTAAPMARAIPLQGKRFIVTGAAVGSIGFETARTLAAWGADVTVTTRSQPLKIVDALHARLGDAAHGVIDVQTLDLAQAASVARFAHWFADAHGDGLDGLINNAGIHLDLLSQWPEPHLSDDGDEIHWRTNYLGTMQLTHLLLPQLKRAAQARGGARVVNVVSQLHTRGRNADLFTPPARYNSWAAYGLSKLALVHATFELQRRHAQSDNVQAYCLHPGAVFTNIASKGLAGNPVIEAVRHALAPIEALFLLTPEEGAQTSLACATQPNLVGGHYYRRCRIAAASKDTNDAAISARLWNETEDWLASLHR